MLLCFVFKMCANARALSLYEICVQIQMRKAFVNRVNRHKIPQHNKKKPKIVVWSTIIMRDRIDQHEAHGEGARWINFIQWVSHFILYADHKIKWTSSTAHASWWFVTHRGDIECNWSWNVFFFLFLPALLPRNYEFVRRQNQTQTHRENGRKEIAQNRRQSWMNLQN